MKTFVSDFRYVTVCKTEGQAQAKSMKNVFF